MPSTNPPLTVTTEQFAKRIGKSLRRAQQLAQDDVLVRSSKGRFKLVESLESYVKHLQDNHGSVREESEAARLEKTHRETELLELRIAKESGDLIDAAEAEAGLASYVVGVNKILDGLSGGIKNNWPDMPTEAEQSVLTSIAAAKEQGKRVHLQLEAEPDDD